MTELLTYAVPITRWMMAFDKLQFYTIPRLPDNWNPPKQLVAELGLFARRLYFEWSEYPLVYKLLGVDESMTRKDELDFSESDSTEQEAGSTTDSSGSDAFSVPIWDGPAEERAKRTMEPGPRHVGFTPKPFSFMQEWLLARRRGQDFQHGPMGILCQAKPLHAAMPRPKSKRTKRRRILNTTRPTSFSNAPLRRPKTPRPRPKPPSRPGAARAPTGGNGG